MDETTLKKKLTIPEQIQHMESLGIQFHLISKEKAQDFITNHTYYFKIKAFAKNYEKYKDGPQKGQYFHLDFAYLKELSTLDMYFRKAILSMTLNIEHTLRVALNRHFSENMNEDGYQIVHDFLEMNDYVKQGLEQKINLPSYTRELVQKYNGNFAIWNLIELLSFGELLKLYKFYFNRYKTISKEDRLQEKINGLLFPVKTLRNAAAHNNCLLNQLNPTICKPIAKPNKQLSSMLSKKGFLSTTARQNKMEISPLHDFVAMICLFNSIVNNKMTKEYTKKEWGEFVEKLYRNITYFETNDYVHSSFEFIKLCIDNFDKITYTNDEEQKLL